MVTPAWELTGRAAAVDVNEDDLWQREYRGGINYYLRDGAHGHGYKLQIDMGLLDDEEATVDRDKNLEFRLQFTASF